MTSVLSFERWQRSSDDPMDGAPTDVAVPVVDGTRLCDIAGDRFPGVDRRWIAPPSREWLGDATSVDGDPEADGRAVLLDGDCGIPDCCGVTARIEVDTDQVRWHDLVARGEPGLPAGLSFTFDRAQYEEALASLAD